MADPKAVHQVISQAKLEGWPYPRTFEALQAAGIDSYTFLVRQREGRYFASETLAFRETHATAESDLRIAAQFDGRAVKEAIRSHQAEATPYAEFLSAIAQAGVATYRVDMAARTVTYHGLTDGQHVEKVPKWTPPKGLVEEPSRVPLK